MPELPEIETIKRDLASRLIGQKITKGPGRGEVIKSISRRGKLLVFALGKKFILIHLKMTGQLIYKNREEIVAGGHSGPSIESLPNKYTRNIFSFSNGARLYFNDLRKFGWIRLTKKLDFSKLGIEPLTMEFTLKNFREIFSKRKSSLKAILLNQALVAGLGNIYADEVCFQAGVRPQRKADKLSPEEIKKLHLACNLILKKAIKFRGTTFSDYRDGQGRMGYFGDFLKVYGRENKPCRLCQRETIKKIKLAGRGTRYCPACQR